jgi:hypothetical protein
MRRHDDGALHHGRQRKHHPRGVALGQLVHDALVSHLVAALVGGNQPAQLGQRFVAVLFGDARGVSVRNLGGALLERGVDEAHVRAAAR